MIHDSDKADAIALLAEYANVEGWTQAHAIPVSVEYVDTFGDVDDDGDGYIMAYTTDDAERMQAALQIAESDICRANALYAADALQAQLASDNADALHMAAIWEYPQYHAREA